MGEKNEMPEWVEKEVNPDNFAPEMTRMTIASNKMLVVTGNSLGGVGRTYIDLKGSRKPYE